LGGFAPIIHPIERPSTARLVTLILPAHHLVFCKPEAPGYNEQYSFY